MSKHPMKDRFARRGSNVRGRALLLHRKRQMAEEARLHEQLARRRQRHFRKLFTKADQKRIAAIIERVKGEWYEASARTGGDAKRIASLKDSARTKLRRLLTREFPQYKQWRSVLRAHTLERRRLHATIHRSAASRAELAWGNPAGFAAAASEFTPPFTIMDVSTLGDRHVVRDDSFARPSIGHLVNNIVYDQDDFKWLMDAVFGVPFAAGPTQQVACGVAYTTPSPGRLRVDAVLHNFYNKVIMSLWDNFGLSSAEVYVSLSLFITIIQPHRVTVLPTLLYRDGLISHGAELRRSFAGLDNSQPYTVTAITDERFNANESLLVLAGSEVRVHGALDDMRAIVDAVLWWQLQKLAICMTE